jgi:hypothetical protein
VTLSGIGLGSRVLGRILVVQLVVPLYGRTSSVPEIHDKMFRTRFQLNQESLQARCPMAATPPSVFAPRLRRVLVGRLLLSSLSMIATTQFQLMRPRPAVTRDGSRKRSNHPTGSSSNSHGTTASGSSPLPPASTLTISNSNADSMQSNGGSAKWTRIGSASHSPSR